VSEKRLRRRTPVRFKQIRNIIAELSERIGVAIETQSTFLEKGNFENRDLILIDRIPLAMQVETDSGKKWFPTLRGILEWQPSEKWAAVDHGAIPFLMNGADCMGAGVQMADPSVEPGDLGSRRGPWQAVGAGNCSCGWPRDDGNEQRKGHQNASLGWR